MRARLGLCADTFGRLRIARLVFCFSVVITRSAIAQTNLPPPPPPPIDNSGGSGSSTGSSGSGSSDNNSQSQTHRPKPKPKPAEPAHVATPQPTPPPPQHHEPEPPPRVYEVETPRTTSIRFNPLPLFAGRLSADIELMLAPHHALVVSPNFTLHKVVFDRNDDLLGYGLGYAGDDSAGFGGEVGYHYWLRRHLAGVYFGPSLVLGATLPEGGKGFAYYGAAVDVGYQYLFSNGFTLNGGGGILIVNGTFGGSVVHAAPRFLFGIGWSF